MLRRHSDLPCLTEDVDAICVPPHRLEERHRIAHEPSVGRFAIKHRESEGSRQERYQVERERRAHSSVELVADRRPKRVEEEPARFGLKHCTGRLAFSLD